MVYNKDPGHIDEFKVSGTACGETALAAAVAAASGSTLSVSLMQSIYNEMVSLGWHDHGTTLARLGQEARRRGFATPIEWDYGDSRFGNTENWHQVLLANAGIKPIVLFLENGQALTDAETGVHDEVGLHGHFICVLDKQTDGYKCVDGDSPQADLRYQVYSYQTLINAQVSGLLVLEPKQGAKPVADKAWPGIGSGLAAELNSTNPPADYSVLVAEEHIPGSNDTYAVAGDDSTDWIGVWDQTHGQYAPHWSGHVVLAWRKYAKELEAEVASLKAQLAAKPAQSGPVVPADLHSLLATLVNTTQALADVNASARNVMKEMGY